MDFKYQSIHKSEEQLPGRHSDSSSTVGAPDDFDADLEFDEKELAIKRQPKRETPNLRWLWTIHAVLFMTSFTLFMLSIFRQPSTIQHVRKFSAWSPADEAVRYERIKYNITTKNNPYVGARQEVDDAWSELYYVVGDSWISKSDMPKLGMPESSLEVDHPQTGETGYRVGLEVFHHLHCLNILRRVTYREYYEPLGGDFANGPEELQEHTGKTRSIRP